ncbi:MAG: hypothetical protein QY332_12890 [Anaerolineales bacterium]|nr:MAG: hypothetical protein QY332_12890 [Anaerolineales bacterium]
MHKRTSFLWAPVIGLLFPFLNTAVLVFGFGQLHAEASLADYLMFFLAGSLIGIGLVYFLRRSEDRGVFRTVLIAFVVSLPFALFGMFFGGAIGGVGIFLLGVSPAIFIIGVGYFAGRMLAKK